MKKTMMLYDKKPAVGGLLLLVIGLLVFSSCAKLDVVAAGAISSFSAIGKAADVRFDSAAKSVLTSPDKSAQFIWLSKSLPGEQFDVYIDIDAAPFLAAGLDPAKLPAGIYSDGRIRFGQKVSGSAQDRKQSPGASAALAHIIEVRPDLIGYHKALDHYGIDLNGAMFEWARDIKTNDKDIVFVVDPVIFQNAGTDPERVEGWIYADVEIMDKTGAKKTVKKLLKPFDLAD